MSPSWIGHAQTADPFQSVAPPRPAPSPRPAPRPAPAPQWRPVERRKAPAPAPTASREVKPLITLTGAYLHRHSFTLNGPFPDLATLTALGFVLDTDSNDGKKFASQKDMPQGSETMSLWGDDAGKVMYTNINTVWYVKPWARGSGIGSWEAASDICQKLHNSYLA